MTQIPGWPNGLGLTVHDRLDSTNEEARRLAMKGERGPLWIVAREQTSGRGRRGRAWISERGNLFATLLTRAEGSVAAQLAFAAGLAVGETMAALAPAAEMTLKWPNDVLLNGKKAAGILLEGLGEDALAVGIGLNLAHHPKGTEFPAISVAALMGLAPTPDDALLRLAGRVTAWYEIWRGSGFAKVRTAWLARAAGLGRPIKARLEGSEIEGMFENLDEDGALLVRQASGAIARVTAGEVFFES
ncbi:MAG TPA: biotin--[acetyl-CoA-carboxylase] ligase [Micropepsaceae bacterium]|nr:biotin--[acetyl-CoA-carboxylase] ligase [Micropepsaceae bacterium]